MPWLNLYFSKDLWTLLRCYLYCQVYYVSQHSLKSIEEEETSGDRQEGLVSAPLCREEQDELCKELQTDLQQATIRNRLHDCDLRSSSGFCFHCLCYCGGQLLFPIEYQNKQELAMAPYAF